MKHFSKKILLGATLFTILLPFSVTLAQTKDYTVLAPLPGTTFCDTGPGCNQTNLQTYLPGIFNFAIGVATLLAFAVITWGGVQYMTSDAITGKSAGREHIENALWGLGLCIAAWVILYTINPQILKFDLSLPQPASAVQKPGTVGVGGGTVSATLTKTNGILNGYTLTTDEVSQDLALVKNLKDTANVTVNNNGAPCGNGAIYYCTNVIGLPQNAITGVENLAETCRPAMGADCGIQITGGTEGGHSDHGPGQPVIDLNPTPNLNAYLGQTNPAATNPVNGTKVTVGGATYTYETLGANGRATGNHWHVSFQ